MDPEYDYLFKIVLIGDSGVGKSSIVKRYEEEIFISTNLPTIGVDFCIKTLQVDLNAVKVYIHKKTSPTTMMHITKSLFLPRSRKICIFGIYTCKTFAIIPLLPLPPPLPQLQIWDTAGQERFRTITQSYYRSADAIVLVYDISSLDTFRSLPEWLEEIERYAGKQVYRVLIGNKSDRIDREVLTKSGEEFARERGVPFMETSAKNSSNIDQLFSQLAKSLRDIHKEEKLRNPSYYGGTSLRPTTVALTRTDKKKRGLTCCT